MPTKVLNVSPPNTDLCAWVSLERALSRTRIERRASEGRELNGRQTQETNVCVVRGFNPTAKKLSLNSCARLPPYCGNEYAKRS
jgi:hypothetical protein